MPAISVIVPFWNSAPYLPRCLDSLLEQTFNDWECIAIDDGSTDESAAIVAEYARRDSRFVLVRQDHLGPGIARNRGIADAGGTYLYFLDSDDWVVPDALASLVDTAETHSTDIVFFDRVDTGMGRTRPITAARRRALEKKVMTGPDYVPRAIKASCFVFSPCMQFLRRAFVMERNLRFPDQERMEDATFTVEAALSASRVRYLHQPLFFRRLRPGSLTTSGSRIEAIRGSLQSFRAVSAMGPLATQTRDSRWGHQKILRRIWRNALHQFDRMPVLARSGLRWHNLLPDDQALSAAFLKATTRGRAVRYLTRIVRNRKAPALVGPSG